MIKIKKENILIGIDDYIKVIEESPELFHDGIDIEILDLLKTIKKYLLEERKGK